MGYEDGRLEIVVPYSFSLIHMPPPLPLSRGNNVFARKMRPFYREIEYKHHHTNHLNRCTVPTVWRYTESQ